MEVKKIIEGMTAVEVAEVIDSNFKNQNKILEEDIATQNSVIGVSEYKDFSEAEAVNVGDVRKYEGFLYECVEATTGAFDASKWKKSSFKAETEKKLSELGSEVVKQSLHVFNNVELQSVILGKGDSSKTNTYILDEGNYSFRISLIEPSDKTVYIVIRDDQDKQLLSSNIPVGNLSFEKTVYVKGGKVSINIAHYYSEKDGVVVRTFAKRENNLQRVVENLNTSLSDIEKNIENLVTDTEELKDKDATFDKVVERVESIENMYIEKGNLYTGDYVDGYIASNSGLLSQSESLKNARTSVEIPIQGGKVYCLSGRAESIAIKCFDKDGGKLKVLAAISEEARANDWYIPSPDGTKTITNGQFRTPINAVSVQFGITLYSEMSDERNKIVLELVGDNYDENFVPSIFDGYDNARKIIKEEHLPKTAESASLPLNGKTIAFVGDSAIQTGNYEMTERCAKLLGAKAHYNYATGGYTWMNNIENGTYTSCCKVLVDRLINSGNVPDVIVFQIGGNDLGHVSSRLGSLDETFLEYNYKSLLSSTTIYSGIRYNLQRTIEAFPNAVVIVGTVFQRRGNDASKVAEPIRKVCEKLAIPVIDGNLYSGISQYMELKSPTYSDNPDGSNKGSREYPQYMWVESDGTIVTSESKSNTAVKVYGKYTYDGTHRNLEGDYHVASWMAAQIASVCRFVDR